MDSKPIQVNEFTKPIWRRLKTKGTDIYVKIDNDGITFRPIRSREAKFVTWFQVFGCSAITGYNKDVLISLSQELLKQMGWKESA